MNKSKDPRQQKFHEIAGKIPGDKTVNSKDAPHYAASVNLGLLQNTLIDLIMKKEINCIKDMSQLLIDSIDRLKSWEIKRYPLPPRFNKACFSINITTKDDYGYYKYSFSVALPLEVLKSWPDEDKQEQP